VLEGQQLLVRLHERKWLDDSVAAADDVNALVLALGKVFNQA
jgi:SOS response regulatory protein OraA/RecX